MNLISDLFHTNREVLQKTVKAVHGNLLLFPMTLGVWALSILTSQMAPMVGFLMGIFLWLANSVIWGGYVYLLERVIRGRPLKLTDFKIGIQQNFRRMLIIVMIVNLLGYAVSVLASAFMQLGTIILIVGNLGLLILLNPLPEVVYLSRLGDGETLLGAMDFVKGNAIEWFLPQLPLLGLLIAGWFMGIASGFGIGFIGVAVLMAVILPIWMVYRGFLYEILSTSTRRKRLFRRNMH